MIDRQKEHRRWLEFGFEPREWQFEHFLRFKNFCEEWTEGRWVIEACPASGKTKAAGMCIKELLDTKEIDVWICIAPSKAVRSDTASTLNNTFGLLVSETFFPEGKSQTAMLAIKKPAFDAICTTYQGICNATAVDVLRNWSENLGLRIGVLADEVHHATDEKSWGMYLLEIEKESRRFVLCTGTAFRPDGKPISLVTYAGQDVKPDYRYTYAQAVADKVVRRVACRFIGGNVRLARSRGDGSGHQFYWKPLAQLSDAEVRAAKTPVFGGHSDILDQLILDAWRDLQHTRKKYKNAGCLVVCRPGRVQSEEKHVLQMAKRIKKLTGIYPAVVRHDDTESQAVITRFRNSSDPWLVAINMVSEGVDIPRLRSVVWGRYTESELLFRQVCHRATRVSSDLDTADAAMIYVPDFAVMRGMAERLEQEAHQGLTMPRICLRCGQQKPCECPCPVCDQRPCVCDRLPPVSFTAIDLEMEKAGGHIGTINVGESPIETVERIQRQVPEVQPCNKVQLAATIQTYDRMKETPAVPDSEDRNEERRVLLNRLNRIVSKMVGQFYDGNWGKAWACEVQEAFRVNNMAEIRHSWSNDQIKEGVDFLVARFEEQLNG